MLSAGTDWVRRLAGRRGWAGRLYAVGLLVVSLLPARWLAAAPAAAGQDKLAHFLVYGGWAWLLAWERAAWRPLAVGELAALAGMAAGYGALLEVLQWLLPWMGRSFGGGDMLANLAGAVAGLAVRQFLARRPGARRAGSAGM